MSLHLHGLGHFFPANEISNAFLESLDIGTNDAWILERVGIRSRRTALPLDYIRETRNRNPAAAIEAADLTIAQMGAGAARMAIERAGLQPSDIGLVIAGCCSPDNAVPATACRVANELHLAAPSFDIGSACTSFFAGIWALSMMQPEALPPYVLIVACEGMTRTVNYEDRASAVLWGDGSAAAVISTKVPGRAQIVGTTLDSDPSGHDKVTIPRLGHFEQDGRTVQMFGIRKSKAMFQELRERFTDPERAMHFIGHQANLRMLENIARLCEIEPERHHFNVDQYGNTAGASGATVLSQRWDAWAAGDDVAMLGVGAGLSWGSFMVRFGL